METWPRAAEPWSQQTLGEAGGILPQSLQDACSQRTPALRLRLQIEREGVSESACSHPPTGPVSWAPSPCPQASLALGEQSQGYVVGKEGAWWESRGGLPEGTGYLAGAGLSPKLSGAGPQRAQGPVVAQEQNRGLGGQHMWGDSRLWKAAPGGRGGGIVLGGGPALGC